MRSGQVLSATDVVITGDKIVLKNPGQVTEVPQTDVHKIVYSDGSARYFGADADSVAKANAAAAAQVQAVKPTATTIAFSEMDLLAADKNSADYQRGLADGRIKYFGHQPAAAASAITTIICTPVYGILGAIALSITKPQIKNLGYIAPPDNTNLNYVAGYRDGAAKKKRGRVWRSYGLVSAGYAVVFTAFIVFVVVEFNSH